MNGANWEGAYTPDVTNYDYGAPISENGTLTDRYRTFRQTIQDYYGDTYKLPDPPAQPEMMELPPITFTGKAGMFNRLPQPVIRKEPVHMEALGQSLGFILYRTKVNGPVKGELKMEQPCRTAPSFTWTAKGRVRRTAATSRTPVTWSFPRVSIRWTSLWKTWPHQLRRPNSGRTQGNTRPHHAGREEAGKLPHLQPPVQGRGASVLLRQEAGWRPARVPPWIFQRLQSQGYLPGHAGRLEERRRVGERPQSGPLLVHAPSRRFTAPANT